jgi:hypothetical protein
MRPNMSPAGLRWNSTGTAHQVPAASSARPATVSQMRSGSPGNGTVRVSSQLRNTTVPGSGASSQRRNPTGSILAA